MFLFTILSEKKRLSIGRKQAAAAVAELQKEEGK
jgi:hypothetical protein